MKTSNKILLSFLGLVIVFIIIMMVVAKANLVERALDSNGEYVNVNKWPKVQGEGPVTIETREVGDFNKIRISDGFDIILTQGEKTEVKVETQDFLQSFVKPIVRDNELILVTEANPQNITKRVYHITITDLERVELSGGGNLTSSHKLTLPKLKLRVSGSGKVNLEVEAGYLDTAIGGFGEVSLTGSSTEFRARIGGSGTIDARNLRAEEADVSIGGSGNIYVWAEKDLRASIGGAGKVRYKGNPKVKESVGGAGSIQELEE